MLCAMQYLDRECKTFHSVYLLGSYCLILQQFSQVGRTPIMAAAGKGHKEVIKVLVKHGADVLLTSHEVSTCIYNIIIIYFIR